jgi:hypothetical protein
MPCAGTHTSSACAPNLGLYPNTRSPSEKLVTPGPTASTTPANSLPRIVARGWTRPVNARMKNGFAARVPQSVRFTVVALTATRNSSGPTTGAGTSAIRTTSGGPYLVRTAALMPRTLVAADQNFVPRQPARIARGPSGTVGRGAGRGRDPGSEKTYRDVGFARSTHRAPHGGSVTRHLVSPAKAAPGEHGLIDRACCYPGVQLGGEHHLARAAGYRDAVPKPANAASRQRPGRLAAPPLGSSTQPWPSNSRTPSLKSHQQLHHRIQGDPPIGGACDHR